MMASAWDLIALGVIILIPYGFPNSTQHFTKLNINMRSGCPTNNIDLWMKLHNISCPNGFSLCCISNAYNSTEILVFCKPVDLTCHAGIRGVFTGNGNIVSMTEEECPPDTYQKQESDCVEACYPKRTDFFQIPEEFAVYSNGSNTEPPQIYCNASAGWYNNKNKTFFDFDSDFTFELGYKIMCLNVKDQNPCVDGLLVLPNGSCVDQQRRDNYMLELKRNTVNESGGNHEPIITVHPLTTTAEPIKTTTELSNNNLTTGSVCGVLVIVIVVILVAVYIWHRRNKRHKPDAIEEVEMKEDQGTGRQNGYKPVATEEVESKEDQGTGSQNGYKPVAIEEQELKEDQGTGRQNGYKPVAIEELEMKEDQGTGRQNGIGIPRAENLRKKENDNIRQAVHDNLNNQFPKVCAVIIHGDKEGTAFCVKGRYVFTALHVISNHCINRDGRVDEGLLRDLHKLDLHVNFNESIATAAVKTNLLKYCYHMESLDVIIMELCSVINLPGCMSLSTHDKEVRKVYVIGYGNPDDTEHKNMDHKCNVIRPTDPIMQEAQDYYRNGFSGPIPEPQGYEGCDNPDLIIYNGYFEHGGSGSPLFAVNGRTTEVVGILLQGVPGFYYNLPARERHVFDQKYVFNVAVKMATVYREINANRPDLAKAIFGK